MELRLHHWPRLFLFCGFESEWLGIIPALHHVSSAFFSNMYHTDNDLFTQICPLASNKLHTYVLVFTHAHGWSMETQTPLATSGFFRRPRTIRVTLAYFYLELNRMESLLKKAVKSAEICEPRNLQLWTWPSRSCAWFKCRCPGVRFSKDPGTKSHLLNCDPLIL